MHTQGSQGRSTHYVVCALCLLPFPCLPSQPSVSQGRRHFSHSPHFDLLNLPLTTPLIFPVAPCNTTSLSFQLCDRPPLDCSYPKQSNMSDAQANEAEKNVSSTPCPLQNKKISPPSSGYTPRSAKSCIEKRPIFIYPITDKACSCRLRYGR